MCSVTTRADTRPEPLRRVFVYVRLCIVCYIRSCDYSWAPWVSWFDGQTDQQTDRQVTSDNVSGQCHGDEMMATYVLDL